MSIQKLHKYNFQALIRLYCLVCLFILFYSTTIGIGYAQLVVPTPIVNEDGEDVFNYEYVNTTLDPTACNTANSSSFCAGVNSAPSNLCIKSTMIDDNVGKDYFTIQTETSQAVSNLSYLFVNEGNQNKPICFSNAPGGYGCPSGSVQLVIKANTAASTSKVNVKFKYSDIFINDFNNNQSAVGSVIVKTFVSTGGSSFSAENPNCNLKIGFPQIPYENYYSAKNNYTNLGRFRKVGEWAIDMTPPEVKTPVTSNYLYDSFDTEWRVKTDLEILDTQFGCYNLSDTSNINVTYLGYLNDQLKYVANLPLFSTLNSAFNFINQNPGKDLNDNNILNPGPFPNCANVESVNAFKGKVNQPNNLINGGSEVAFKTKYKLEQPDTFENFQHIFKTTDLACNTRVSEPGGAGMRVAEDWISTDGGTVYYSNELAGAQSPQPPATSIKIDSNLYCTYNYNSPAASNIFYDDANSDNTILDIAKSVLFNDTRGKSNTNAKEMDYAPGENMLINLLGSGSTHFETLLNQIKSQTRTVKMPTVATRTLNNIDETGCDPADERCYIEIEGNTIINGDDGIPNITNYFCDRNALFFIDGDLTIKDNIYKQNNVQQCCGFIVNGNINFEPTSPDNNYNRSRYQSDYLSRNDVEWFNTYECSTGFYYSENNITIQQDRSQLPISSIEPNHSDPLMLKGDILARGTLTQGRSNGLGNLSRPAVYLSKDSCILNNFPELSYVLLQTRERDFNENESN